MVLPVLLRKYEWNCGNYFFQEILQKKKKILFISQLLNKQKSCKCVWSHAKQKWQTSSFCIPRCETSLNEFQFFIITSSIFHLLKKFPQVDIDDLVFKLIQFQWASLRNYRFPCNVVFRISKKLIFVRLFVSLTL